MQRLPNLSFYRPMLTPKIFYFCYYAAAASLMPFLSLYYAQLGLSGRQIGLLAGLLPLITIIVAPVWGALADTTRRHGRLLTLAIGGTLLSVLALSRATSMVGLLPIVVVYALFSAPIIPLVDNTVVAMLGERRDEYGKQRLWGAVGWGIAAPVAGQLIDRSGLGWAFYGYLALMFGGMVASTRLPVSHASIGGQFRTGLRSLATNRPWMAFLFTTLIGFVGLAMAISFLFLYLDDLGADKTLMGLSLTVATLSELPVWFFSDRLLRRWGARGTLALSLLACAGQAFAYSFMRTPWLVLPIQLLHGPAFSAMWAAGVSYASEMAPEGMGATAQGVFAGVAMGLRSALGAFLGGLLYDGLGPTLMFRWGGVSALVGLLLFALAGRRQGRRD
jgi:PPP family 3-phenylpropionic acid transporter